MCLLWHTYARGLIKVDINEDAIFPELLRMREEAVSKFFKGRINLSQYTEKESLTNSTEEDYFLKFSTGSFVSDYLSLIGLATVIDIINKAKFYELGINFLQKSPFNCPFCHQKIDNDINLHIIKEHEEARVSSGDSQVLVERKEKIISDLILLKDRLKSYDERNFLRVNEFITLDSSLGSIKKILTAKQEEYYKQLEALVQEMKIMQTELKKAYDSVINIIELVEKSIELASEDNNLMKSLSTGLMEYISVSRKSIKSITNKAKKVSDIDQVVQHELDSLAGTEEISLLIDLLDNRSSISKKIKTEEVLENLKLLRKETDKYVGLKILNAVSGELTKDVMAWYEKIKTQGDPDIHFDGFDLDRTLKGELKARKVVVKAKSYGENLVSAVSSLSESKLNALGLCVSIATNLKKDSPFDFLVIDDPIQSLDADHEIQFIDILLSLIEDHNKQIILLSHDKTWIDQVLVRCRQLNGLYYEITQYSKDGPHISAIEWMPWKERLKNVHAVLADNEAGSVKLQQIEEEIRLIVCQLTSEIYYKRKGITKGAHSINEKDTKRILTECGIDDKLINKIVQTFQTTDDSHHIGKGYSPNRQRIFNYYDWVLELSQQLEK
jgi:hypothetical protein